MNASVMTRASSVAWATISATSTAPIATVTIRWARAAREERVSRRRVAAIAARSGAGVMARILGRR